MHLFVHLGDNEDLGDKIKCHTHEKEPEKMKNLIKYVNALCWTTGLYVTPESFGAGQ